jgi:hypothetical protein
MLAGHIAELAESLHDLRRHFRQTARLEVARAVAEALRHAAMAVVCGPAPMPAMARSRYEDWDDPWADALAEPYAGSPPYGERMDTQPGETQAVLGLSPAVWAGVGAARWCYVRTGNIGPAVLIGLLVVLVAEFGGPSIKALLESWNIANDLLSQNEADRAL